jgi:hypothetical protein
MTFHCGSVLRFPVSQQFHSKPSKHKFLLKITSNPIPTSLHLHHIDELVNRVGEIIAVYSENL